MKTNISPIVVTKSKPMTSCGKWSKYIPDFDGSNASRSIDHIAEFKAIELARCANGVRAHIVKAKPVAHLECHGERGLRANTVDGVTGRTPHTAQVSGLRVGNVEGAVHGQNVWVDNLVIEENTVESAVYAIVDVV